MAERHGQIVGLQQDRLELAQALAQLSCEVAHLSHRVEALEQAFGLAGETAQLVDDRGGESNEAS